ncbi:MAG: hypothetical protein ACI9K9_001488, partial [Neolewinella sp.]
ELAREEAAFLNIISIKEAALNINELDAKVYAPFFDELYILDSTNANYLNTAQMNAYSIP